MIEDEKMQVAVFRFSVISDFIHSPSMSRQEKSRLLQQKCSRKWQIPFSEKTRWIAANLRLNCQTICGIMPPAGLCRMRRAHPAFSNGKQAIEIKISRHNY